MRSNLILPVVEALLKVDLIVVRDSVGISPAMERAILSRSSYWLAAIPLRMAGLLAWRDQVGTSPAYQYLTAVIGEAARGA